MKVWVTRTEPGAGETARRLRALGHDPVVAPLLAVRPLPFSVPDGVGALAFTSRNAVAAVLQRPEAAAWRTLPAFAVGDATADAARAAGFGPVESAGGDVGALSRLLAERRGGWAGSVLHPTAREPAEALDPAGVAVVSVAAYEAVDQPIAGAVRDAWRALDAVLIHSPRAGRVLAREVAGLPLDQIGAVCISEAAARPLRNLPIRIAAAEQPTETAVLHALGKLGAGG